MSVDDEIGHLSTDFNSFADLYVGRTKRLTGEMSEKASTLSVACQDLTGLADTSRSASDKIRVVPESTEQLRLSLKDVSQQTQRASSLTTMAAHLTARINESISDVKEATGEIDQVIMLIRDIAEQTKLLALSAIIEAAKAGDAARRFAVVVVVATVKELARQSNVATVSIEQRVRAMHESNDAAAGTVVDISNVNKEVDEKRRR